MSFGLMIKSISDSDYSICNKELSSLKILIEKIVDKANRILKTDFEVNDLCEHIFMSTITDDGERVEVECIKCKEIFNTNISGEDQDEVPF